MAFYEEFIKHLYSEIILYKDLAFILKLKMTSKSSILSTLK